MEKINRSFNLQKINGRPLRLLLGGSPCTHWSIAKNDGSREVYASGVGWELFKNYLIAKNKFLPDLFIYENNKSASAAIKNQISKELGVELQYINSSLVSAQNRERFYAHNMTSVSQPDYRNICFQDVLDTTVMFKNGMCRYVRKTKEKDNEIKFLTQKELNYMVRTTSDGRNHFDFSYMHCSYKDKSQCLLANIYKGVPYNVLCERLPDEVKDYILITESKDMHLDDIPIYLVKDNFLNIKSEQFPVKLVDGYYIFRKMLPVECERLQTLPDNYTKSVSNTQRYKGLGNGWTAEVIIHLLKHGLKDIPKDYPIEVLSMYDGIGTGRYCLDKMGYTNITYKAYEIDKFAMTIANDNYSDIIQCGDAYQVRNDDWKY